MIADIPDAVTVSEFVAAYENQGYVISFTVEADGMVRCGACRTASHAKDLFVDATSRVEGPSDPDDEAMVVALRCPWCALSGVLVVGYGPQASVEDSDVVSCLPTE